MLKKIILLNKKKNITSNKIIQLIKKKLKIQKIGHCGTLDPAATGLLIICIEKNTKIAKNLILHNKIYILTAIIGIKSQSNDFDGKINLFQQNKKNIKIKKQIKQIKNNTYQTPSIFSSIKHNSVRLYTLARLEINIKIKKRKIKIHELIILKKTKNIIIFKIKCSYGVYIRSIIEDINQYTKKPICAIKIQRLSTKNYNIINSLNLK
jgi:tRNA pseudouridine55 synthase